MTDREREINEALVAGDKALRCLKEAQDMLRSAGNWGLVDMFGGGFLSTYMKHSKIDNAQRRIEDARTALRTYSRELDDVDDIAGINVNVDDFLHFADYFFDGFVADFLVQSRIDDSKRQVEQAIRKVEQMQRRLQAL